MVRLPILVLLLAPSSALVVQHAVPQLHAMPRRAHAQASRMSALSAVPGYDATTSLTEAVLQGVLDADAATSASGLLATALFIVVPALFAGAVLKFVAERTLIPALCSGTDATFALNTYTRGKRLGNAKAEDKRERYAGLHVHPFAKDRLTRYIGGQDEDRVAPKIGVAIRKGHRECNH